LTKPPGEKTESGLVPSAAGLLSRLFVLTSRLIFLMVSAVLLNAGLLLPAFVLHPDVNKVEGILFRTKQKEPE
jgi:hypothetical protein